MPTKTRKADNLKASEFFYEIKTIIFGLNYFTEKVHDESVDDDMRKANRNLMNQCLAQWEVAKSAILYITGKTYAFTRTDDCYGIVNEADESDWLYKDDVEVQCERQI